MNRPHGILLPGQVPQGMSPPPVQLVQPLNDAQLVAVMAAQLYDPARGPAADTRAAVALALELIAEAVVQGAELSALIRAKQQERRDAPEG